MSAADWHVYIVRCADDSLYTGIARQPKERIASHNSGKGAKSLRGRLPVELVYSEPAADRGTAQQREYAIKQLSRHAKLALIAAATAG